MLSVLLIDDEPALLEVLKLFSERSREMSVHTTQSATEALKLLPDKNLMPLLSIMTCRNSMELNF